MDMDPITFAIVTSLLGSITYDAVKKSYETLKIALKRKYGAKSNIVEAVTCLEQQPDSRARQRELKKEVIKAKADKDLGLLEIANELLEKIGEIPGANINQNVKIRGDRNIVTGQGDVTVNE